MTQANDTAAWRHAQDTALAGTAAHGLSGPPPTPKSRRMVQTLVELAQNAAMALGGLNVNEPAVVKSLSHFPTGSGFQDALRAPLMARALSEAVTSHADAPEIRKARI